MQQINLAEASQHLPDLIEAAFSGEEIIIINEYTQLKSKIDYHNLALVG